jgi:nicotinamide riboside kinase
MAAKPERSVSIYVLGPSVRSFADKINILTDFEVQSTGKTTLCNALAQKLNLDESAYVTEVARHVMKEKGYSRDTINSLQMQEDIMEAHMLLEQESAKHAVRVCDRTAIDPIVYAVVTSRDEEESRRKQNHLTCSANFQKALQQYRESIVILLKPVAGWLIDDGIRSTENQDKCLQIYRRLLAEMDVPYYELGTEMTFLPERVGFVMGLARL